MSHLNEEIEEKVTLNLGIDLLDCLKTDLNLIIPKSELKCEIEHKFAAEENVAQYFDCDNNPTNPKLALWKIPEIVGNSLKDLPSGKIGTMLIRKSGRVEVFIGSMKFDFDLDRIETNAEEVVKINPVRNENTDMLKLGLIDSHFLLDPDWHYLLSNN